MEKTIKINGQDNVLEAKAFTGILYESQFGEDPLPVMWRIADVFRGKGEVADVGMIPLAKLTWAMAKTHDESIPDFDTWFKGLDTFPTIDVFNQISELVLANLVTTSDIKPKNPKRAEN